MKSKLQLRMQVPSSLILWYSSPLKISWFPNSHPFSSDMMASKGFKGAARSAWRSCKKSGSRWKEKSCCPFTYLFVSPNTSQLLSPLCHSHHSPCSGLDGFSQCLKHYVAKLIDLIVYSIKITVYVCILVYIQM